MILALKEVISNRKKQDQLCCGFSIINMLINTVKNAKQKSSTLSDFIR